MGKIVGGAQVASEKAGHCRWPHFPEPRFHRVCKAGCAEERSVPARLPSSKLLAHLDSM